MTDRLMTAREVGEALAVSTETVLRWARRGELVAVRLPRGAVRFRPETLEEWLLGRKTPPGEQG